MEYIIKNGAVRAVINRYKAVRDKGTGKVNAFRLKAIYRCTKGVAMLLWLVIHSCFGSSFWQNDMPWSNNDGWNNGT